MATYFIDPYKNYYDKLNVSTSLLTDANNLLNSVESLSDSTTRLTSQVESANWKELGYEEIKLSLIPLLKSEIDLIKNNVSYYLVNICNKSINELLPKLKELKTADEEYEITKEQYNNLNEPTQKYEKALNQEDVATEKTAEYKRYEKRKNELSTTLSEISTKAKTLQNDIDNLVNIIKGIKLESNTDEEYAIDNKNETSDDLSLTDIERKKTEFIGDVDNDEYTIASNAGKKAQVLRLFYNGKELSNKDEIVVKKGETIRITVKLPTTAGKINQLTRTTADGASNWRNYASGYSEPFVDRYNSNTFLHTNTYDWVITANKTGSTTISQTAEMSTDTFSGIKSMVVLNLKIVD